MSRITQYIGTLLPPPLKLSLKALLARLTGKPGQVTAAAANVRGTRPAGLRILVCDDHVPAPNRDAGSARMFLILKSLLEVGRPLFISLSGLPQPDHDAELRREGIETAFWANYKRVLKEKKFDVAILSRPDVAEALVRVIRKTSPDTRIIFDTVDISFVRLGREYKLTGDERIAAQAKRYQKLEGRLARDCDQVWCVTLEDQAALMSLAPAARFEIIPTIHPLQERGKGFSERRGAVFIGNYLHRPNVDAIHYFMRDIFPLVRTADSGFKLFIVGDNAPPDILAYESDEVKVTGFLPEANEMFHSCRVFVAPLRFGSGMKGKIGQALSYGVPVVTTAIGAEGMGLSSGSNAIIADSAQQFAGAVLSLDRDAVLWQNLSDNGFEHVRKNFTPEVVEEKILDAVRELMSKSFQA